MPFLHAPEYNGVPTVQPMHYRWTEHFSACGLSLARVQWPIRLTTQADDTTCERCQETLRAAGLTAGVAPGTAKA